MEDTDGGLHSAVGGQSLDGVEDVTLVYLLFFDRRVCV